MHVWCAWLAAVSSLERDAVLPHNLPRAEERLLLTVREAETMTGHSSLGFEDGESPGLFFNINGEVVAHLYVTSGWDLHIHYNSAR